ncbi:Actin, cytoplasmic 2 [Wickerhamomyces ciferrii]|uniref:Actin-like protein ARP6 n=1 Tax=Wickerhamomyces ciferrii (strain ATCC 14091 / BCRC 22168 / CBS 111 / JCM 3599 / NBRC 0793 / NRRL Y-1031 F-60-10) TaxID=1206466 RepID=K0KST4_WICCF|nr:Actin, cytoplasmic 2 [Wickerhamomyces ciferrii]CCH46221.1 Actin, cytoplasmic 2 [Wickerhamomyces ciferrii]
MSSTVILDNGSYDIKIGYNTTDSSQVQKVQNTICKTKDRKILISNQVYNVNDINGIIFKRPIEKGHLTSWELEKQIWDYSFTSRDVGLNIESSDSNLILSETPFTLPQLSMNTDQIIFEEYGFKSLFKNPMSSFIPWNFKENETLYEPKLNNDLNNLTNYSDFQLVIDSGFNATWIIPIIKGVPYWKSIRKFEIGGRFLSGVLREMVSFRHYNVTDETILVNNIKEKSCFVTMDYNESLKKIKQSGPNDKDHIIEYVLPDFNTTTQGYVLTPELKSKYKPQEQQILKLYDERFSIPETIFHPEIVNINNKPGLIETIIDCIYTLPEFIRPLIVSNIICIGGNFQMENYHKRILKELKVVLPVEWDVRIGKPSNPTTYGWECAQKFSENELYKNVRVSKQDYEEHGLQWTQQRFGFQL